MAELQQSVATSHLENPNRYAGEYALRNKKDSSISPKVQAYKDARERKTALHGRFMDWLHQEREKQSINRYQMAIDEDFYDSLQWADEDALTLMERGQAPLTYNLIKPTINWLLGMERRTRVDGKVLPREPDDEDNAETKSKILKYVNDVNRTQYSRSDAWESCVTAGVGWLEDGINPDPEEELLYSRYENWRYIYHDSSFTQRDGRDMRFVIRFKWLDLDVAESLLPDCVDALRAASVDSDALQIDEDDTYYLGQRINNELGGGAQLPQRRSFVSEPGTVHNRRTRVKIYEIWYRDPRNVKVMRGRGKLNGKVYDEKNPDHKAAADEGMVSIVANHRMQVRCALFTDGEVLYEADSPYNHNRFPLTPMWCYRRKRDGAPYGVIRDLRDPQEDYNKRASKALFILSTNRIVMDVDAHDDIEELRAEAARPDGILTKKKGSEMAFHKDDRDIQYQLQLMDRNAKMIFDTGGVTEANLGRNDAGQSGVAIGKLQDQGSMVTAHLFDNRLYAIQTQSSIQLSLIEQYYSEAKAVRIVGDNKPIEWLKINQFDEASGRYVNDITAFHADYIIAEQDFKATQRQAMFESMMLLMTKLPPEISLSMLDMVIDFADVPNKTELVNRIRKINGQRDPNTKPTPEELQIQEAAAAKAKRLEDLQILGMEAEVKKKLADIEKVAGDAKKAAVETMSKMVTAFYEAIQAAGIVVGAPMLTPVADGIMEAAGYTPPAPNGVDPNIPQPAQAALPAPAPVQPIPDAMQSDGAQAGIQTAAIGDGMQQ